MKVSRKKIDDKHVRLTVEITAEEASSTIDEGYRYIAQQMRIQPVKDSSPKEEIEKHLDAEQIQKTLDQYAMQTLLPKAITEKKLLPAFEPQGFSEQEIKPDEPFKFTATVFPVPEFSLSSYDPVEASIMPFTIAREEIDEELKRIAHEHETVENDTKHDTVQDDSKMRFTMATTCAGEPVEALTAENRMFEMGQQLMPQEFEEGLKGMKVGETKDIEFEAPGLNPGDDGAVGLEKYVSTITIESLLTTRVPAITNAWVEANIEDCNTLDEYEEKIRLDLTEKHAEDYNKYKDYVTVNELAKRFEGNVDDDIYEAAFAEENAQVDLVAAQQGMSREDFFKAQGIDQQQFTMSIMMQTRERTIQGFCLDAWARHNNLKIDDSDREAIFMEMAGENIYQIPMIKMQFETGGRMFIIDQAALRMKANRDLTAKSTLHVYTDEEVAELQKQQSAMQAQMQAAQAAQVEGDPSTDN